jgi:hypothetical protein
MSDGEISWNNAKGGGYWYDGGDVYVLRNTTFNMTGGEVTLNNATTGAGLFLNGAATLTGNPSIGSKVDGKGSIYGNEGGRDYYQSAPWIW